MITYCLPDAQAFPNLACCFHAHERPHLRNLYGAARVSDLGQRYHQHKLLLKELQESFAAAPRCKTLAQFSEQVQPRLHEKFPEPTQASWCYPNDAVLFRVADHADGHVLK